MSGCFATGEMHQFSQEGEDDDRPCNGSYGDRQEHVCPRVGHRKVMCEGFLHAPPTDPREAGGDPCNHREKTGNALHSHLWPGQVDGEETGCRGEHAQAVRIQARKVRSFAKV